MFPPEIEKIAIWQQAWKLGCSVDVLGMAWIFKRQDIWALRNYELVSEWVTMIFAEASKRCIDKE